MSRINLSGRAYDVPLERFPTEILFSVVDRLSTSLHWDGVVTFRTTKDYLNGKESLSFREEFPGNTHETFLRMTISEKIPDAIVVTEIDVTRNSAKHFVEAIKVLMYLLGAARMHHLVFIADCSDIKVGYKPFNGVLQDDGSYVISVEQYTGDEDLSG